MFVILIRCVFLLLNFALTIPFFQLRNVFSGDPATSSIFFSHVDIFPKPIQIPGNITTAYDITINRRIGEHSNFSVGLTIERKMPNNSWVDVPCNKNCAGSW